MSWTTGTFIGGTPVIDYKISYAVSGSSSFSQLAEGVTATSFSTTALT